MKRKKYVQKVLHYALKLNEKGDLLFAGCSVARQQKSMVPILHLLLWWLAKSK